VTNKAPAYQWYPKDYDTDEAVKLMTYEQEGIYRRLLDHQALHGSIPSDPRAIAKLVPKISAARFLKLWPALEPKFKRQGRRRVNLKLRRVKGDFAAFVGDGKSRAGRASAQLRLQLYGTAQPQKPRRDPDVCSGGPVRGVREEQVANSPMFLEQPRTAVEPASASASAEEEKADLGTPIQVSAVERLLPKFKKTHGRLRSPPRHGRFR